MAIPVEEAIAALSTFSLEVRTPGPSSRSPFPPSRPSLNFAPDLRVLAIHRRNAAWKCCGKLTSSWKCCTKSLASILVRVAYEFICLLVLKAGMLGEVGI